MNLVVMISIMFMVGVYSFFMKSSHLLNMLFSLEFLSMIIYMNLLCMLWLSVEKYILIYFLTFCVCEGALGISVLVSLVRSFGNDYLQSMMFTKC